VAVRRAPGPVVSELDFRKSEADPSCHRGTGRWWLWILCTVYESSTVQPNHYSVEQSVDEQYT
jgi:hypothetical protein